MLRLLRQLFVWAPGMRGTFATAACCKVAETLLSCGPYCFAILTLRDLLAHEMTTVRVCLYTAGMAACYCLQGLFGYLFTRLLWPAANDLVARLRIMAGEHLRRLPMSYFSEKTTGRLHTLVSDEMKAIQVFLYQGVPDVIATAVFVTVVPAVLALLDWRLSLITLSVIPLSVPLYLFSRKALSGDLAERSDCLAVVNDAIVQYIQGIEVAKAFGVSGSRFALFEKKLDDFRAVTKRAVLRGGLPIRTIWIVLDMGVCLIPASAICFMYEGTATLTVFLVFLIMGLRIYEPFKGFFMAVSFQKLAEPAVDKLAQLFATPVLPSPESGAAPERHDICFEGVSFGYGDKLVLDKVSFAAPARAVTALVGPSGSGKTTITRLIARFWDVDGGSIRIGGMDIRRMDQETLLSRISMVFQDVYLFNDTIFQNIAYGRANATREQVIEAARAARCHDFIMKLPKAYETMVGEGGATLSGGERQRISIARAMIKDAPIILLDEATASQDPENEALIQQAINELVASRTLIVIAHRLSTVTRADRILVLNKSGSIEEAGRHDELLARGGAYAAMWKSRVGGAGWSLGTRT